MEEKFEDKDLEKDLEMEEAEQIPEKADYEAEIINIIRSDEPALVKKEKFNDYHENDIASVLEELDINERRRLYALLGLEKVSEIFAYLDDPEEFIEELDAETAADILENMEADDAVDILEELEDEKVKNLSS